MDIRPVLRVCIPWGTKSFDLLSHIDWTGCYWMRLVMDIMFLNEVFMSFAIMVATALLIFSQ